MVGLVGDWIPSGHTAAAIFQEESGSEENGLYIVIGSARFHWRLNEVTVLLIREDLIRISVPAGMFLDGSELECIEFHLEIARGRYDAIRATLERIMIDAGAKLNQAAEPGATDNPDNAE